MKKALLLTLFFLVFSICSYALEWCKAPSKPNGSCIIVVSGGEASGKLENTDEWIRTMTENGFQCVRFRYRTTTYKDKPFYHNALADGQRVIKCVRKEAARRGFNPERIGFMGFSAGAHLGLLLAMNSQTTAYPPKDATDTIPCHLNWLLAFSPAYVLTDSNTGTVNSRDGYGPDVKIDSIFRFDGKSCPVCFCHGGDDPFSPCASTQIYRQLRRMNIPAELHLYADMPHGVYGMDRAIEFMRQMGYMEPLGEEIAVMDRYRDDVPNVTHSQENIWEGRSIPNKQENQNVPFIEWWIPEKLTTTSIQILFSGGAYNENWVDGWEIVPVRKFLNRKGMAVVTLKYRSPRPSAESGLSKHTPDWQDLQRTIRLVRSQAADKGLNPNSIGILGYSAGGHMSLMGATSALHKSYLPEDSTDLNFTPEVQWAVSIFPAYALTDGIDNPNIHGGNEDEDVLVQDFSFDLKTAPTIFFHGDADYWCAMNSVKAWEKMRSMGIQGDLHTYALRSHCFQMKASPGTGSYTWMEQLWDFLKRKNFH